MKRIQLWLVSKDGAAVSAVPVDEVQNTETEQLLEDILVASPELVEPGLKLIGRQVPTDGGPLDLLGVDQNGRLTVFELKRGTLTRGAVAQSLDYASDLKNGGSPGNRTQVGESPAAPDSLSGCHGLRLARKHVCGYWEQLGAVGHRWIRRQDGWR